MKNHALNCSPIFKQVVQLLFFTTYILLSKGNLIEDFNQFILDDDKHFQMVDVKVRFYLNESCWIKNRFNEEIIIDQCMFKQTDYEMVQIRNVTISQSEFADSYQTYFSFYNTSQIQISDIKITNNIVNDIQLFAISLSPLNSTRLPQNITNIQIIDNSCYLGKFDLSDISSLILLENINILFLEIRGNSFCYCNPIKVQISQFTRNFIEHVKISGNSKYCDRFSNTYFINIDSDRSQHENPTQDHQMELSLYNITMSDNVIDRQEVIQEYDDIYSFFMIQIFNSMYVQIQNIVFGDNELVGGIKIMSSLQIDVSKIRVTHPRKDAVNDYYGPLIAIIDIVTGSISQVELQNSQFYHSSAFVIASDQCSFQMTNFVVENIRLKSFKGQGTSSILDILCQRFYNNFVVFSDSSIKNVVTDIINLSPDMYSSGVLAKLREGVLRVENSEFQNNGKFNFLDFQGYGGFIRSISSSVYIYNCSFQNFENETRVMNRGFLDFMSKNVFIKTCNFSNIKAEYGGILYWRNMQAEPINLQIEDVRLSNIATEESGVAIYQHGSFSNLIFNISNTRFTNMFCLDNSQKGECKVISLQKHTSLLVEAQVNFENCTFQNIFANQFIEITNHKTTFLNISYKVLENIDLYYKNFPDVEFFFSPLIKSISGEISITDFVFLNSLRKLGIVYPDCQSAFLVDSYGDLSILLERIWFDGLNTCNEGFIQHSARMESQIELKNVHIKNMIYSMRNNQIKSPFQIINWNSNFQGEILFSLDSCTFENIEIYNYKSGLFYLFNFTLFISNSQFSNIYGTNGVVFFLDILKGDSQVQNSNFFNNRANSSGGVMLFNFNSQSENYRYSFSVIQTTFKNNSALVNGGVISFRRPQNELQPIQSAYFQDECQQTQKLNCTLTDSHYGDIVRQMAIKFEIINSIFELNSAQRGKSLYFKGLYPILKMNSISGFSFSELFSYPSKLILIEQSFKLTDEYQSFHVEQNRLVILGVSSGATLPPIPFSLIDNHGNLYIPEDEKENQLLVYFGDQYTPNEQQVFTSISLNQDGVFELEELTTFTNSPATINLLISHPSLKKIDETTGNIVEAKIYFEIIINFRECMNGEIVQQFDGENIPFCQPCSKGTYSVNQQECEECPAGGICYGGTLNQKNNIQVVQGYWRPINQDAAIIPCPQHSFNIHNCVGGQGYGNDLCKQGYIGAACLTCDIQKVRGNGSWAKVFGGICSPCETDVQTYFLITFSVFWIWFLLFFSVRQSKRRINNLQCLKQQVEGFCEEIVYIDLSVCFQIVMMYFVYISSIFRLDIPLPYFSTALSFIIDPLIFSSNPFECILADIFPQYPVIYSTAVWNLIFPLLISFFYILLYITIIKIAKKNINPSIIVSSIIYQFLFMQPRVVQYLSRLITCEQVGDQKIIFEDSSRQCYSTEHLNYINYLIIPVLVSLCLVVPALLTFILRGKKDHLECNDCIAKYSIIFFQYQPENRYWEIVKIEFRVVFSLILALIADDVILRGLSVFSLLIAYYFVTQYIQPYRTFQLNQLDKKGTLCACVSILIALVIQENYNENSVSQPITIIGYILIILINIWYIQRVVQIAKQYNQQYIKNSVKRVWSQLQSKLSKRRQVAHQKPTPLTQNLIDKQEAEQADISVNDESPIRRISKGSILINSPEKD